jgi:hypothetical protein
MWTARRILKDLADAPLRHAVLVAFWRYADDTARLVAVTQLARALHFREETIRKMPPDKKADLLASRASSPDFEQALEAALMQFHTHERNEMLGAFLDEWKIPHVNGSIEVDDYTVPTPAQVRDAVTALDGRYDRRDVALYLASLGLLMGDEWRAASWPVVDEMASALL